MKTLFSIAFSMVLVWAKPISAQQVVPPLKREFLDSNFVAVASVADARYRRETEYKDSVGGELRDYFLSGRLQSSLTYEHFKKILLMVLFRAGTKAANQNGTRNLRTGSKSAKHFTITAPVR
ncbi:hypothetical protein [Hymenobacter canadensis]|uniref:Uncharacterized protein n=1 Tax=Hymenobacter canadensis TaxID=2999067 RepID=A0ABY7LV80_9BACT|nr:hypothetical protein [Hymenobacter canadensis]WBA43150.1 hypothetical protein O3303_06195 [Hymenobacter canadensis]